MASGPDEQFHITLVHGTFAPASPWTLANSAYQNQFIEEFGAAKITFARFKWNAWFVQSSRVKAAIELGEQLARQLKKFPESRHFVVGHSHGGNIALRAIQVASLDGKIRGLVCLNTPFVFALRRNLSFIAFYLLFIPIIFFVLWWARWVIESWNSFDSVDEWTFQNQPAIEFVVGSSLLLSVLLTLFLLRFRLLSLMKGIENEQLKYIREINQGNLRKTKLLSAWNADDEIYNIFFIGEALSTVPYFLAQPICFILLNIAIYFLSDSLGKYFLDFDGTDAVNPTIWLLVYLAFTGALGLLFCIALIISAAIINTVFRILPVGFALSDIWRSMILRVSTGYLPVSVDRSEVMDMALGTSWFKLLNHSRIHQDRGAVNLVGSWIRNC